MVLRIARNITLAKATKNKYIYVLIATKELQTLLWWLSPKGWRKCPIEATSIGRFVYKAPSLHACTHYNAFMNENRPTQNPTIRQRLKDEFIKASLLSLYFAVWFCSIAFLTFSILREDAIPVAPFGFALIKAAICAKFMLIGQALFPLKVERKRGLIRSLLLHSIVYLLIVLALSYLETGIEGMMHGKSFISALEAFGNGDPVRVAALALIYWLILWPYLLFAGLRQSIGDKTVNTILFGNTSR